MSFELPRRNNPAELRAFDQVCERLAGFEATLSPEYVDGFLAALAAGPVLPEPERWLPLLCDDAFDRAFADPADRSQALRALKARLAVLRDQLDPEALMADPDALRLFPLMDEWTDADRRQVQQDEGLSADEAGRLQTGAVWAAGFLSAQVSVGELWPAPSPDEAGSALLSELLSQVAVLTMAPGGEDWQQHLGRFYAPMAAGEAGDPVSEPGRDQLIDEACFAVQALRLWWTDHAARPQTLRVQAAPGRNEACHCGSGKKYKKCHGAAA